MQSNIGLLDDRVWLWVFGFGVLCLALAVYLSTLNPPSEYELSIYAGVHGLIWPLIGSAIAVSIFLSVYGEETKSTHAGFTLGTSTVVFLASLPLLRSYWFFGRFDALNHLGKVQDMLVGVSANTTIYPGIHLLSAVITRVTGLPPKVALLLTVPVFVLLFALGLYSLAICWGPPSLGKAVAGVVPLTMPFVIVVRLPKLQPLPTVVALLLFPLLLYLLFNALQARRRFTICLLIVAVAHIFYHPQHALVLTLGIFLGNIFLLVTPNRTPSLNPRFGIAAFVATILIAWLYVKPAFWGAFENVLVGIDSGTGVVEGATPTGDSLQAVGGSLVEVGLKVFGPKMLLIATLVILSLYLFTRLRGEERLPSDRGLYTVAFMLAAGLFVPVFAVGFARSQMFRYVGAGLIFVTILLLIYSSERTFPEYTPRIRNAVAVLLFLSAVTAVPALYKSPYVYQPGEHVTQGEFEGYGFVFENDHEQPIRTFGTNPDRYRRALYGRSIPDQAREANTEAKPTSSYVLNRTIEEADGTFLLTEYKREENLRLYPKLGYTETDFEYLQSGPGIHKLYANGGTTVYSSWNKSREVRD